LELWNFVPNHSEDDKNAQNSVPNHFTEAISALSERKTFENLFQTIQGKRKTLHESKKNIFLRNSVPFHSVLFRTLEWAISETHGIPRK
jgi:hypothetical protein